jgi:hypothetical protein
MALSRNCTCWSPSPGRPGSPQSPPPTRSHPGWPAPLRVLPPHSRPAHWQIAAGPSGCGRATRPESFGPAVRRLQPSESDPAAGSSLRLRASRARDHHISFRPRIRRAYSATRPAPPRTLSGPPARASCGPPAQSCSRPYYGLQSSLAHAARTVHLGLPRLPAADSDRS